MKSAHRGLLSFFCLVAVCVQSQADTSVIEEQLKEIGSIPDEEVVVVQKKYTRKLMRHELTPVAFGGVPFGTVRRTLFGGASYTLHFNDWLGWEAANFLYSKNFFSSFTDDINNNKAAGANQPDIRPDIQKLLFFGTSAIQITPFYGKASTFSRWIGYLEPFLVAGAGIAKTETKSYFTFFPGVGIRIYFREWVSLRVEFRDYMYTEEFTNRTTGVTEKTFRNNYAVTFSLSFWIPKMPG